MYINLEDRKVLIEDIVSGFIPDFILEENPLFLEFLKSYFRSREAFGSDIDIIRNILQYQKIEKLFSIKETTTLSSDATEFSKTITVASTDGYPSRYGLVQINDEIITYEYKNDTQFINCSRGFSGATELGKYTDQNTYTFKKTNAQKHSSGDSVKNISILFLKEFLFYLKSKYLPGFENIDFYEGVSEDLVIASIKDFYSSKGTFNSFEILFRILYGADPIVFLPKEKILKPSDSQYINTTELIVEVKSGNVDNIKGSTIFQESNVDLDVKSSEGVVFDVNFLESIQIPERFFESGTSSQSGNIITIVSNNHGLKSENSVFIQFSEIDNGGESESKVYTQVLVVDTNTFQVFSSESKVVSNQSAKINTIIENSNDMYKIKLSRVDGEFYFAGKTLLRKLVSLNDNEVFVDSTVGFPESGSIEVNSDTVQYTSKSVNAFKGCTGIDAAANIGSQVTSSLTVVAYENGDITNPVVMRVVDSTSNELSNDSIIVKNNTRLKIKSIGSIESNYIADSFIQNTPVEYEVAEVDLISNKLTFKTPHNFLSGDRVDIKDFYIVNENGLRNKLYFTEVLITTNIDTPTQIEITQSINPILNGKKIVVSKSLQFGRISPDFPNLNTESANVQRVLKDDVHNYYALTSSIPNSIISLNPRSKSILKTFRTSDGSLSFGSDDSLTFNANHNYNSGDKVNFTITGSEKSIEQVAYVKKINQQKIKLSQSASSVDSNNFIDIDSYKTNAGGSSFTVTLIRNEFVGRITQDQQLIRQIRTDNNFGETYDFDKKPYQPFGVLVDGVDLYPPFTDDEINYGKIESIISLDGGTGFDVINGPVGVFTGTVTGVGCSVKIFVEGEIKEILVTNKGKNIKNIPSIKVLGGNNSGVKLSPILVEEFISKNFSPEKDVNLLTDTITFSNDHQFETGDRIKYSLVGIGTSIGLNSGGSLIDNSEYFIININSTTVKLANTKLESLSGTAIDFGVTLGSGAQKLTSVDPKTILDRVEVVNPGKFKNHQVSFSTNIAVYPPSKTYQKLLKGINIESDYIYYRNHGFSTGELIQYTSESTVIGGLVNNNYYYIIKLDNDSFRLAHAGSNLESPSKENFEDNLYVKISSLPISTGHVFRIPPITFTVEDSNASIIPTIEPIIRGSIKSVTLDSFGQKYGSQVLNLIRSPRLEISKGSGSIINLVVSNGIIDSAYVASGGSGYFNTPDLIVNPGNSSGKFAKLFAQVSNGIITSVDVISGGSNYDDTASVTVRTSGSGENFDIQLQKWRVNTIAKNILNANGEFTNNEHYIIPGRDSTNQIISSYVPKVIRSKFGDTENRPDSDIIGQTFPHSKIVGWAFDGNPIYAQFGYRNATSTSEGTKRLRSCYTRIPENVINDDPNRPNITDYSIGYFINDYFYNNQIGDLDEFNGRYCITPEFPDGIYAYFSTIGPNGKPSFPYGIYGLKDRYSSFNLDNLKSKQSYLREIQDELTTCTSAYSFDSEIANYPFLKNEIGKELLLVQDQNKSFLKKLNVIDPGDNYKVDDAIVVENNELFGKNAKGLVTSIEGVGINTITTVKTGISTVFFDIRPNFVKAIIGFPHNFVNRDNVRIVIAGVSTNNFTFLNDTYPINVINSTTVLVKSVPNSGVTTELQISDSVESLKIFVDDFVQINDEKMKVLRVDNDTNQIRVQRNVDGTTIDSHASFTNVNILPSTFEFKTGIQTSIFTEQYNKVYFNKSSAGIGSTSSTTIDFVGIQTQIKVSPKRLYTPSHNFETNQKVVYNFDTVNGIGLTISDTSDLSQNRTLSNGDELFVIKYDEDYIGLSSERVFIGAGYTSITYDPGFYFPVDMSGDPYDQSFTFNELPLGEASELQTTIDTSKVHGLSLNDKIKLNVKPNFVKEYQLFFDTNYNSFKLSNLVVNSGVSSVKNTITYTKHGLETNDKIIYFPEDGTALGPDFVDGDFYFVKVFSENTFSLGKTKNALLKDDFLNITANSGSYLLSPLDPKINAVRGSKVKFVGIATLPTSLQFFDANKPELGKDFDTSSFTFTDDSIEIDTTNLPSKIFIYSKQSGFSLGKFGASIEVSESVYDNEYIVTGISSTTQFNIELLSDPSVLSYGSTNSSPEYTTTSNTAVGPINDIEIINRGSLFLFPTGITTVKSNTGSNAIIDYELQKSTEGTNVTRPVSSIYDFTSDKTYSLNIDVPSIVSVKSNNKIVGIKVVDSGKGYIEPPKVKIIGQPNIYSISNLFGNSVGSVNLISKNNGILSDSVTIFADFHTNGIEVSRVTVEANNTSINLFIKEPNNGFINFPFAVDDEIYVDGLSTIANSGTGFNSSDYGFTYFKIIGITETPGSANIRYSIAGLGQTAGTFDSLKSYGRVIKKEDLAKFEAILEPSNYTPGEIVTNNGDFSGRVAVDGWNSENKILSIIEKRGKLSNGDILTGAESGTKSIINSTTDYKSTIIRNSLSQNAINIEDGIGNLNDENQVLPDNFYYQPFAYDIISEVSLDKWESTVSNINHISGFEKFGTFVLSTDIGIGVSFNEGSTQSSILIVNDAVNLNTAYQFDLASENVIDVGSFSLSDEITFNSRRITDSIEAKTNRAVLIDDISPYFTGEYDADDGGQIVGVSSFRLTTSETGITTSLFVKYFDSAATTVVSVDDDKITIPFHNFSTGELLEYSVEGGTLISIGSTDKTLAGVTTTKLPSQVFAIRIDDDNIRLAGLSSDAKNNRYFDISSVASGLQKLTSTTQNTRCMLLIDGIIQNPLTTSDINVSLGSSVGTSTETSITLSGITSINTNSLIQIEDEIIRVDVVGFGSTNVVTTERGVLGSVAAAHTVGAAMTIREGQYIIRDDVVFFDSPPLSGVNTIFNFNQTGIPTSFSRMKFHGRVFSRLSYENNKIFDDISQQFDGTEDTFELLSNGNSTEDIFSSNVGILTGTDVSSGVILLNNIFQIPSIDYDLIQNVGVGASVQFTGTSAKEDLPIGGQITEFAVERGGGYQPLTRASAIIDVSAAQLSGGSIVGLTLVERGSGYREDTLVTIHNSNPGTGATIFALVGTGTYDGNEVNITNFVYDNNTGLSTITLSGAHGLSTSQIPDVVLSAIEFTCPGGSGITTTTFPDTSRTQFKVLSINSSTEIEVNVGISTIIHTYDSGGTVKPGSNVGLITGFRIDSGGSNYTSVDSLIPIIPSPKSYSQLSLQGGTGSGAVGDLVIIGAGGTTFTFELTDGGIGYRETDILTISGIPTSPYYSGTHIDFSLTVNNTSRDVFSAFTFGEMLLFDDISPQANGARVSFSLTRTISGTKSLVSLDTVQGSTFDIRNNLLVFVNDILQVPGVAYQFNGGTKITFSEPPKKDSKISILYYKGSDEDILEIDILETVKKGDLLRLDKYGPLNLGQQNQRRVFDILSSDVAETNDYSNIGLGTDPNLLRSIDWTKQSKDLIINGEIIYKTRPELITKPIPNTNIIKSVATSDLEIFVDTVKNFEIDSLSETDTDLLLIDNSLGQYVGASATISVSEKIVQTISVSAGGSGYYDAPSVSIFSPVPQEKITGISWDGSDNVGVITYTTNTDIGIDPLAVERATIDDGVIVTVADGSKLSITGVEFIGREFNSIQYSTSDQRYVVVGDNGIVGYSTVTKNINHLIQPAGSELFNEKLNGSSTGVKGYGEVYYIVGDGVIGFASDIKGVYSRVDTAFPPVVGGIVGSSNLDPNTKVSFTNINLLDVKYFDTIDKAVAIGGTIMINSFVDPGEDWQMINIDSSLGGPEGQYLNAITYYNKQDGSNPGSPVSAGYVAVGHTNYIFKSHNGTKWNEDGTSLSFQVPDSSLPGQAANKNFLGIAANDNEIVVVGTEGLIIRATSLKSSADSWTYVGISTTEDFIDVVRTSNSFVAITTTGKTFTSVQGITWTEQSSELYGIGKTINDFLYVESLDKVVAVGASSGISALIAESDNSTVVATFTAGVTNGIVTSITINNPGYGYSETNPPIVQVAPPIAKYENIENIKVEGDYGIVVSISTVAGINTDIGIQFELKTDPLLNSSLYDAFTITSSGIDTGYYFSITDSIFASSEQFAGVDESNNNIVFSDGLEKIYRASSVVTDDVVGITTIVADINLTEFADLDSVIAAVGSASTEYSQIARYSWGRIYDFDRPNPKSYPIKVGFGANYNNTGLSSNPVVIRTTQIKENY